jgi:integrase
MAGKTHRLKRGTIYQKQEGGTYYFRYQVNGHRKAVSLQTRNLKEATAKAEKMVAVVDAPSLDVVAAHVAHVNFGQKNHTLTLGDAWQVYESHPDRATPSTVSERESYRATWRDFVEHAGPGIRLDDVTPHMAAQFANELRKQPIAVDTHNRKIRRIKKVFSTLSEHYTGDSPFGSSSLMRKAREEQENAVRRESFTKEQEQALLEALDNPGFRVRDKAELRVLFHLGMFTGQRLKDCALLQWGKVNLKRQRIWVKQFKTGKEVTIPVSEQLLAALLTAHEWQTTGYVLPSIAERYQAKDPKGKCVGVNFITMDVLKVIRRIGLKPSVKVPGRRKSVTVYGFHSLRHSFASHCAEAGVPKAVAQSILGAASDIIDKYYVHIGEEAQLKAIEAISIGQDANTPAAQTRIDQALAFIEGLPSPSRDLQHVVRILAGESNCQG